MGAKLVLEQHMETYNTRFDTISDIAIDSLPFLIEREPVYDIKGQKSSKSYYDKKGREAIRIVYERIVGDYVHDGITYPNTFLGIKKKYLFMDWAGEVGYEKVKQPYTFNLEPVFIKGGGGTISGFSSKKQREILRDERYCADDYLQAKNPDLYAILYARYTALYEAYLKTGDSTVLVTAINAEEDEEINYVFNMEVYGFAPLTVRELIIMNLQ